MQATCTDPRRVRRLVLRIFEQERWGNVELLDGWDGEDLEEPRMLLDEEEFRRLLERLEQSSKEG